ncbi:P-loop containing nucleoside triphosphate hydrolase protein [Rhodofomes roseus]|uniref:P-loop containing nucleoside triphosphate hydrolase protein n=1 Tax=Rhodofomes roseus TaxID=34475 RepID=A0ABQ8KCP2_9APHY|nr:P-loop containing nucleoside triphosphate hydrolase protein [Rhodofomes roseus]KAH9835333.1 P-loop containing nucleoside triphosphate hydrolase protein [Rhodofomes roseus]
MNPDNVKVVLILVGLIGSGKSTFAQALEKHVPRFRRCNQDDLGNRQRVEALARESLDEGLSVCIDRSNFDARQRATWISIAREFPGTEAWVLVLDTPYEVCAQRLQERTDHPTIKSPSEALPILSRFSSQYRPPSAHEGYTRFLSLPPSEQPLEYTREDVLAILDRLRDAQPPPEPQSRIDAFFPAAGRGYGVRGGWRGGGGGGGYRGYGGDGYRGYGGDGYRGYGGGGYRGAGSSGSRGASGSTRGHGYMPYERRGWSAEGSSQPQQRPGP